MLFPINESANRIRLLGTLHDPVDASKEVTLVDKPKLV
jgi:hypothetical protein